MLPRNLPPTMLAMTIAMRISATTSTSSSSRRRMPTRKVSTRKVRSLHLRCLVRWRCRHLRHLTLVVLNCLRLPRLLHNQLSRLLLREAFHLLRRHHLAAWRHHLLRRAWERRRRHRRRESEVRRLQHRRTSLSYHLWRCLRASCPPALPFLGSRPA